MSDAEIVQAWKDPEADRLGAPSPLGEPDLAEVAGGMVPITTTLTRFPSFCGSCGIGSYGCC